MLIKSVDNMIELWKTFSDKHKKILIYWNLWAGKTHFVKGFVQSLGIDPDVVQSPTYTYINIYDNKVLHIDLYRLETFNDFIEKWILEMINDFEYICIEWPKFEESYTDNSWIKIKIEKIDPDTREIIF